MHYFILSMAIIEFFIICIMGISSSTVYYKGIIKFKRINYTDDDPSIYFFDVAVYGRNRWQMRSIEVSEVAYNAFKEGDNILIKM